MSVSADPRGVAFIVSMCLQFVSTLYQATLWEGMSNGFQRTLRACSNVDAEASEAE